MAITLKQAIGRMDAAVEIEEPQHTVFTADKATWAVIRAHLSHPVQAVDVGAIREVIRGFGYTTHGQSGELADAVFKHISTRAIGTAQEAFTPDWVGYRQGVLDGCQDVIGGAARGQSLGMVVYHDDEHAAARLEGQRVLIVPLPTPPTDGEG